MAAAESPSSLHLKTHLKQKTAKRQQEHQAADVFFVFSGFFFFLKAAFVSKLYLRGFYSSLVFLSTLREQKHSRGEFGFTEILWILKFFSQCIKLVLWYEQ